MSEQEYELTTDQAEREASGAHTMRALPVSGMCSR